MSERSTAAPNVSVYQTSGSPQGRQGEPNPSRSATHQRASIGAQQEHGPSVYQGGDFQSHEIPPRVSGVHNILNPLEARSHQTDEGGDLVLARLRGHGPASGPPTPAGYGMRQPYHYGQPSSASQAEQSVSPRAHVSTPAVGAPSRTSPSTGHSASTMQQPPAGRRILSPRAPRPSSMIHGGPSRDQEAHAQGRVPSTSPAKRPYEPESTEERRPHPGSQPSSVPHTPNMPGASISRSFSQPLIQPPGGINRPPGPYPQPDVHGRGPLSPSNPAQQSPRGTGGRSFSTSVAQGDQQSVQWTDPARRPSIGTTLMGGDGQALMMLPGSDTPISVSIDNTQGSKKATEKRGKNAKASNRFRKKKKEEQEKQSKRMEDLEAERDLMRAQMADMSALMEHHRNEHHRLREIVRSTSSIAHLVEGRPTSPPISRPSLMVGGARPHDPVHDYSSEASTAERPAQRPRLEDHSRMTMHAYSTTPVGTPGQTPLQSPVYGSMPPRPESASSSAGAMDRLPPLRSMEGLGSHPPQGPPQEQDPRIGQWTSIQSRQLETGWATGHRRPGEGPQR